MKLLLIGLDGQRLDVALPEVVAADPAFAAPDHEGDPRFAAPRAEGSDRAPDATGTAPAAEAPTLRRLAEGGRTLPVWMTPPTDSGPGWSALLTGTPHEQNNVWSNEFVDHRLAETPDILTRIWAAAPRSRTFVTGTWKPFTLASGPGPILQRRPAQEAAGQHIVFTPTDFSDGSESADDQVVDRAVQVLGQEGPDASVVVLDGIDHAGHEHGASSAEYRAAIGRIDDRVRRLVAAVAPRVEQDGEEWLIGIIADHGHAPEGGHGQDQVEVRRSFLMLHRLAADQRARVDLPADTPAALRAEQVTPLLLRLLGVTEARMREGAAQG